MKEEIEEIRRDIARLAPHEVTIVAATKTQTIERINELIGYGITVAGENRVQELLEKYTPNSPFEWQFIGVLQTNKVKYIVDKVSLIQSLDKLTLAAEIQKQCAKINKVMPVLIEVNIGREEQKSGVMEEDLPAFIEGVRKLHNIKIEGLMTVLPVSAEEHLYARMNELFGSCQREYADIEWKWLSMGMSGDYKVALTHGANMIRLGEKLFGKRNYHNEQMG